MSGKLYGLTACAVLVAASILSSWLFFHVEFWHQHLSEDAVSDHVYISEDERNGDMIALDKSDYHLNEYLFRNLAGELFPCAPVTFYMEKDGGLIQFQQSAEECVRGECEYAILISRANTPAANVSALDSNEPVITFTDYNYLDSSNRTSRIAEAGGRDADSIRLAVSRFEKSLYSYDYDSRLYGYRPRINTLCFADYFLLYELAYPGNCIENNALLYYDKNEKYCICTGSFPDSGRYREKTDYHNLTASAWFSMLLKSRYFTESVIREYRFQRKHLFSEEYLFSYAEDAADFLAASGQADPEALEQQKDELCGYLRQRLEWLDDNIESLREFSALSAVKDYRNTPY